MAVSSGESARAWISAGVVLAMLALALAWQGSAGPAYALAPESTRVVRFHGEAAHVPAGWPVIRLAERPRACVRLDRRAVYLGSPSPDQRCPASVMGRRRAILVEGDGPQAHSRAHASGARARISGISGFVGLGFDACAAPSRRSMRAWDSSPYRAVGVYIGGLNRGCSQPNLTASWVSEQIAAGWSLIPTYVGLQAPTSSCTSCATLSPSAAASQGSAAAVDAVEDAAAIGIGPGSPIYYDMESYSRTSSATSATVTLLAAWTAKLHSLGYVSGVYSSGASGIADLVDRLGTSYLQPDHLWIANWDGRKTADDPYVPDYAWSEGQRIRQYRGGHDETWGGVAINIDNNYVEGATAGSSVASADDPKGRLELAESPLPGQLRVSGWAFDPDAPGQPLSIRVYVGGKPGQRGALLHELGPVAAGPRPDIALSHQASGGIGGFDAGFLTLKTGRERLCAYAVDVGLGSDKPLGCRTVGVAPPLSLVAAQPRRGSVGVTVRCDWPAGTQCPGRILLRARVRIRVAGASGAGRRARTKVVRAAVGRRPFRLWGGASKTFNAPLSRRGRLLARDRDELRTELVVAVPDGRIVRPLVLRPRG
jgi:Rv2525c-like, glycoside hydrolase-like domain